MPRLGYRQEIGGKGCGEEKIKNGSKLDLNLWSNIKINMGERRRGRVCNTPLVPRNGPSVKVRLTAENYFREPKRYKGREVHGVRQPHLPQTHRHTASTQEETEPDKVHDLLAVTQAAVSGRIRL